MLLATLGCLLGIILATRARRYGGWRRARFLAYALVCVAVPGIWQPALVGVLGLRVDGSVIRLAPVALAESLAVTLIATAVALLLICYGRNGLRLVAAGVPLAVAIIGCEYLMMRSLTTGGQFAYDPPRAAAAVGIAAAAGAGLTCWLGATRSVRSAAAGAVLVGLALTALHLIAASALGVQPPGGGPIPADQVTGLDLMATGLSSVVLTTVLTAMLGYFSVGTATGRDLRLIFDPNAGTDQIDPWFVDQVRSRVALSSTSLAHAPGWSTDVWAERTVAVRSIPLLGGAVASAFARARTDLPLDEPVQEQTPVRITPTWRPVPGWGVPAAAGPAPSPEPASPAVDADGTDGDSATVGAATTTTDATVPDEQPPRRTPRPTSRWDERDRDHREPVERNENRVTGRGRATNSRQGSVPTRSPAGVPHLVPAAGADADESGTARVNGSAPLPRRNARS
jgi:NO-binding membrane sensor protein with MHYT domain